MLCPNQRCRKHISNAVAVDVFPVDKVIDLLVHAEQPMLPEQFARDRVHRFQ